MVEFKTIDGRRIAIDEKSVIAVIENDTKDALVKGKTTIVLNIGSSLDIDDTYENVVVCVGESGLLKAQNKVSYMFDDECLPIIPIKDIDTSLFSHSSKNAWTRVVRGLEVSKSAYDVAKERYDATSDPDIRARMSSRMNTLIRLKDIVTLGDLIKYVRKNGCNDIKVVGGVGVKAVRTIYEVFEQYGFDRRGYKKE